MVKPEQYSPDYKGYLTYPSHEKINAVLLKESKDKRYFISFGGRSANNNAVTEELKQLILKSGGKVDYIEKLKTTGKTNLFNISVSIRKILKRSQLDSIRIRVTGKTIQEVIKKLEDIKNNMSKWGVKPTECIWDRENIS